MYKNLDGCFLVLNLNQLIILLFLTLVIVCAMQVKPGVKRDEQGSRQHSAFYRSQQLGSYSISLAELLLLLLITFIQCYSPLSSRLTHHCTLVACDFKWVTVTFYSVFLNIHRSGVLTALFGCYIAGAMWNCCHLSAFCVHHTTMHHVTSLHANYVCRMHVCLTVTCHHHFWQNDRDILCATVETRGMLNLPRCL